MAIRQWLIFFKTYQDKFIKATAKEVDLKANKDYFNSALKEDPSSRMNQVNAKYYSNKYNNTHAAYRKVADLARSQMSGTRAAAQDDAYRQEKYGSARSYYSYKIKSAAQNYGGAAAYYTRSAANSLVNNLSQYADKYRNR